MVVAFILEGLFVEVGEVPVPGEEETVVVNVEGVVDVCAGDFVLDGDVMSGWGGGIVHLRYKVIVAISYSWVLVVGEDSRTSS